MKALRKTLESSQGKLPSYHAPHLITKERKKTKAQSGYSILVDSARLPYLLGRATIPTRLLTSCFRCLSCFRDCFSSGNASLRPMSPVRHFIAIPALSLSAKHASHFHSSLPGPLGARRTILSSAVVT